MASIAIAIYAMRRRSAQGAKPLAILMGMAFLWSFAYALELGFISLDAKLICVKIEYVGIALVPLAWLALALDYTGRDLWLMPRRIAILSLVPLITILLSWTNELHGLIYKEYWINMSEGYPAIVVVHGAWYWVNVAYSYTVAMAASVLMLQAVLSSPRAYRFQPILMLTGAAVPLAANAIYLVGFQPSISFDITPLAFVVSGFLAALALFRFGLLDIMPVARDIVIENMAEGIVVLDRHGRILDMNPSAERMTGFDKDSSIGRAPAGALADLASRSGDLHKLEGGRAEVQLDGADPGARRHLQLNVSHVAGRSGELRAQVLMIQDITARKRAEEELISARDSLEKSVADRTAELESKNVEMERFIYTVSHDLRSPLVAVSGLLGFLKKDLQDGNLPGVSSDLEMMDRALKKMDRLLMDTLELSRIGRVVNPPQAVLFGEIVDEALRETAEGIQPAGVELSVHSGLPVVMVDRMRITEALVNLIENSLKYMGDAAAPRIEIGCRREVEQTVFYVKDNGIGIAPSQHQKVFDLFYKVDTGTQGSGAGLAIVRRIIEVHGGRVWIESELKEGTSVCFTLPTQSPDLLGTV